MGLSPAIVRKHIEHWQRRLRIGNRPHRQHWPARLFRHEPLENAAEILKDGVLLSRRDAVSAGKVVRDIAPATIIDSRVIAHEFVRLYFRPKSPTQYHIEGISKPHELYQGRQAQALAVMVFRAADLLTRTETQFSDGNMQSPQTVIGGTDQEFETIPFDQVYHEGSFDRHSSQGDEIRRRRCAEVLLPSPLQLNHNLQSVLCRSPAERATLLYLVGSQAERWSERIRVFTEPGLFESRYAYMNTVDGGPKGISFTLHPRRDGGLVTTSMWVWDSDGHQVMHFGPKELDPTVAWISRNSLESGSYLVRFELEGCLAYEAPFIIDELPF